MQNTTLDPRLVAMQDMRQQGENNQTIGTEFNLSRERVRQLLGNFVPEERTCLYCGNSFTTKGIMSACCSDACTRGWLYHRHEKRSYYEDKMLEIIEKTFITDEGCWEWRGSIHCVTQQILINWHKKEQNAIRLSVNRFMWEVVYGEIPDKIDVHRTCNNWLCCNPEHLQLRSNIYRNHQARVLNVNQVKEIRESYTAPSDAVGLAKQFNVHPMTIYKVATGKSYKGIECIS